MDKCVLLVSIFWILLSTIDCLLFDDPSHRRPLEVAESNWQSSARHIHVGNLDWSLSVETITEQLHQALSDPTVRIVVKPIPTARARDRDKCHGGSAVIEFDSPEMARIGWQGLQTHSDRHHSNYRLRYPPVVDIPPPSPLVSPLESERRRRRTEQQALRRVKIAHRTDRILDLLGPEPSIPVLRADAWDWSSCPPAADSGWGLKVGSPRAGRKRAAVEAFGTVVRAWTHGGEDVVRIADLGCGTGNLALPLQWWLMRPPAMPIQYRTIGVDRNGESIQRMRERRDQAGLRSFVEPWQEDLRNLMGGNDTKQWHVIVSLHACGAASDMAMAAAVARSIPFCISPCCIGKVLVNDPHYHYSKSGMPPCVPEDLPLVSYPRSKWLQTAIGGNVDDYKLLAKAADYGVFYDDATANGVIDTPMKGELERRKRCQRAKRVVEMDRLKWAEERGYQVRMVELPRIGPLYPKRELLLGAPKGSPAALQLEQLPTEPTATE